MSFPTGADTIVLTMQLGAVDGSGARETVTITPSVPQVASTALNDIREGTPVTVTPDLGTGQASVRLLATDASGYNPTGWTYSIQRGTAAPYNISLPVSLGATADLADLTPVSASVGTYDVLLPESELGGAALLDVGTAAGTVAAGDDGRFGRLGGTVTLTGTPTAGQVPTATSGTSATWQTPSGGGGGASIRTASVRITDDNLAGLPSAASWAIVTTSGGTPLQAQIAAAAGDRIRVCANYMRSGSHFLDWALLDSAGAIAQYAGSGTATPLGEGNPAMYPSLSFSYVTSSELFVVGAGNLSAGRATVALAHQGTGTGLVYAHTTYPWRLRLENLGPEPS